MDEPTTTAPITFGNVTLAVGELRFAGQDRPITHHEYIVAEALFRAHGEVVRHDTLLLGLYGSEESIPQANSIQVFISRLRKHFKRLGCGLTVGNRRGFGYRLEILPAAVTP